MSFVKFEKQGSVAVLTIDRPEALNALNSQVLCDLDAAISQVEADDERGSRCGAHWRRSFFCGGR